MWCPLGRIKKHQGAGLCPLLLESHFSDTTHQRYCFRNTGLKLQCRQLKEEETLLPRRGMIHSPGSQPQIVALMALRLSSWIFLRHRLYDFSHKGEAESRRCRLFSGHPAGCLVSGQPRTGLESGARASVFSESLPGGFMRGFWDKERSGTWYLIHR